MNTLTVVIPAYNADQHIGATIAALCEAVARIPAVETEVVLVDDGSTDATAARAEQAAEGRVPLRVVRQANAGRFLARRRGLEEAIGETVLLLD
ncbi:glycosyltransferase, partial [Bradyrhizobium sp. NBAIM08]|uniref:glycosyltransferase family 2 protein n=1 Tax=Bradyrhizobium sp. NBAIM08 TaxID=2793815 RepID=UPI001CD77B6E